METINVTIDQNDIDRARTDGYIIKEGVLFRRSMEHDEEVDEEHIGQVILSESTLYREGTAVWKTAIDDVTVIAEYDRPSLEEFIESERRWLEDMYEDATRVEQREWLDGIAVTLNNVEGWL